MYGSTFYIYSSSIQHHGRLGQKWGAKNGPPYPLSRGQLRSGGYSKPKLFKYNKKKNKEEPIVQKQRSKEEILRDPTPKELKSIRTDLTNDEIERALSRIDLNKKIDRLIDADQPKKKAAFDIIDNLMSKLKKINTWADTGIDSYLIIKSILDGNMTRSGSGGKGKGKK